VENQVFIGIDVSKVRLDVALRPGDESFDVANNQRGIATLVKRLKKLRVGRIVMEASGGSNWRQRVCRWQWSIRARYGTLLVPRADWQKPTRSTLEYWRISLNLFSRKLDPFRTRRPAS